MIVKLIFNLGSGYRSTHGPSIFKTYLSAACHVTYLSAACHVTYLSTTYHVTYMSAACHITQFK